MKFTHFDPANRIVQLCVRGMDLESQFRTDEARLMFESAWEQAEQTAEKIIAAHYLARHQESLSEKLKWNTLALELGITINDEEMKACLPSLYLNVGRDYEDIGDLKQAKLNYREGLKHQETLRKDDYGKMIMKGLSAGIERVIFKEICL